VADDFDVGSHPSLRASPIDWKEIAAAPVLEACLWATRIGLLDLQWDLLCPMCRGPQRPARHSSDVEMRKSIARVAASIFTVNFDRFVEVTFGPESNIRNIDTKTYCVGQVRNGRPHVVVQQTFTGPGLIRTLTLPLEGRTGIAFALVKPARRAACTSQWKTAETKRPITASPEGWLDEEILLIAVLRAASGK